LEDLRARIHGALYREHVVERMARRGILPSQVLEALLSPEAEIIEDYPGHRHGPCSLVLGWWDNHRPLHVVLGGQDPIWIISVWDPSIDPQDRWEPNFRRRRRSTEG